MARRGELRLCGGGLFPALSLVLGLACSPTPPEVMPPEAAEKLPDVVFISLDTTRADALSAYGAPVRTTPHLDRLAAQGLRFAWAFSHVPTTLSAHASVFTGLDPHGHRVVRNGGHLDPALPTLAEALAARGYQTIGVVGSSALHDETGIARGFSVWDQQLDLDLGPRYEARADQVTDRALAQLAARDGRPLFLFVHYFDAHGPYSAPAPYTRQFAEDGAYAGVVDGSAAGIGALSARLRAGTAADADRAELLARYRGEVAWVDSQVGRLVARLPAERLLWVFGDHGERLGEPGLAPIGHGQDVDEVSTHVPLLVSGLGLPPMVVDRPVGLSDLAPTTTSLLGLGRIGEGQDLSVLWRGGGLPERPLFLEASQPAQLGRKTGWPNLDLQRGVVAEGHLYFFSPWRPVMPSLRRLGGDEVDEPERGSRLRELVRQWDAAAPSVSADRPPSDAQAEALRALGYAD